MKRIDTLGAGMLTLLFTSIGTSACTSPSEGSGGTDPALGGSSEEGTYVGPDRDSGANGGQTTGQTNGQTTGQNEDGSVVDASPTEDAGTDGTATDSGAPSPDAALGSDAGTVVDASPPPVLVDHWLDGVKNADETDIDCGGMAAPTCVVGQACLADTDCTVACSYAQKCVQSPSCAVHLGGDTCGLGEVGEPGTVHESCCRSLPVPGFVDPSHPGAIVQLDKYEITAGRVRAFVERLAAANGGNPDVLAYLVAHPPTIWNNAWDAFVPTGRETGTKVIARRLLGDPRPEDSGQIGPPGPGVILPPATDQTKHMGTNYQFGSEVYVDLHGNDCATHVGSYGFPTFFYPAAILARDGQVARPSGVGNQGQTLLPQDLLDVKSMNCITNAMLVAFCAWDGGQLATTEVLDYVTATPTTLGNTSGCGVQYDNHGELLGNSFLHTLQTGGRCAPVSLVNATFDAGDALPNRTSSLNFHGYRYPNIGYPTSDKSWEVAAPGRGTLALAALGQQTDKVRVNPGDEPWIDLAGNLNESALETSGGVFTGKFGLKFRGIGYGTSRSVLNVTLMKGESILRVQRPEAKAAYAGGRCMRFL